MPASTVLARSAVAEGGELFLAFLSNLRRLYPEVYGPGVSLGRAPDLREFPLREGEGLSSGTSVTSLSKLRAYAGRFNNLSLARMNNPRPNLINVYLDTPLVVPTPEPLEYAPHQAALSILVGIP